MRTIVALLTVIACLCSPAYGWSEAGHKIVASIAFRRLTLEERDKIVALLERHPRFALDFKDNIPPELDTEAKRQEWLFQQAALWPDLARYFPDDAKAKFDHPTWHYVNRPHFLAAADRIAMEGSLKLNVSLQPPAIAEQEMNVIQAIRGARSTLASLQATPEEKGLAITWLFHTVGDLHQPMHSTALFSPRLFPLGDRGGNSVRIEQRGNLHAVWDQFPGLRMTFEEARNRAIEESNDQEQMAMGEQASLMLDESVWWDESHRIAVAQAYDAEVLSVLRRLESAPPTEFPPITLSDAYLKAGGKTARQRVVQAGFRLGAVLKEIAGIQTVR